MRTAMFWTGLCCVLLVIATWRGDVADAGPPGPGSGGGSGFSMDAPPEPITGQEVMPNPGSETEQRPPFTMYSHGGSNAVWSYSQLSPAERAYIDNEPSKGGDWAAINNAYAAASREQAQHASAEASATQLGLSNLATTGVVQ